MTDNDALLKLLNLFFAYERAEIPRVSARRSRNSRPICRACWTRCAPRIDAAYGRECAVQGGGTEISGNLQGKRSIPRWPSPMSGRCLSSIS